MSTPHDVMNHTNLDILGGVGGLAGRGAQQDGRNMKVYIFDSRPRVTALRSEYCNEY